MNKIKVHKNAWKQRDEHIISFLGLLYLLSLVKLFEIASKNPNMDMLESLKWYACFIAPVVIALICTASYQIHVIVFSTISAMVFTVEMAVQLPIVFFLRGIPGTVEFAKCRILHFAKMEKRYRKRFARKATSEI